MPSKNLAVSTVPLLMPYIQRRPETVGGKPFKLVSDYTAGGRSARGDPPADRGRAGRRAQPGAAGRHRLGQDLHHGQRHCHDPPAGAGAGAQQDPGGPAVERDEDVLPGERGRVFRLVLRLLPARSLRAAHRHLHREGFVDQRADRPHAPLRDARADGARRRHHRGVGVLHLRHRSAGELPDDDLPPAQGPEGRPHHAAAPLRRAAVQAQRQRLPARHLPGARRHRRPVPGALRGQGVAHGDVRRRDRIDRRVRSADRREDGDAVGHHRLRQQPLRDAAADDAEGHPADQDRPQAAARRVQPRRPSARSAAAGAAHACSTSR